MNWQPPSKRQHVIFVLLATLIFMAVPMYQAARQPRVGDVDIIRVGLVTLNHNAADRFPGDPAMQAGVWWPNYIPLYMGIVSAGYQLLGDFELLLWLGCALAYLLLLGGFYLLGRRLGLSLGLALLLAWMCGLYIPSALVTSWTGLGLEMASARNLYLALLPWILLVALYLYQQHPHRLRYWALFGLALGGLASLHPVDGTVTICILGMLILLGAAAGKIRLSTILMFAISALPGLLLIYLTIYAPYTAIPDFSPGFSFNNLTRANIFFYRLPGFIYPVILYTLATLVAGVASLRSGSASHWKMIFAAAQFFGALVLLPQDWLILLVLVLWIQARHTARFEETVPIYFLFAVNVLALCVGLALWLMTTELDIESVNFAARAFLRSSRLSYAAVVVLGIQYLSYNLHASKDRWLLLVAVVGTVILGFHEQAAVPELDAIPYSPDLRAYGQWLPLDGWTYAGIALVALWRFLPRPLKTGGVFALLFQGATRLLAAPAGDAATLLVGMIVVVGSLGWERLETQQWKKGVALATVVALVVVIVLPVGAPSVIRRISADFYPALLSNWSRNDTGESLYPLYEVGVWLRQNTPPDSLILSDQTFLRYWAMRSTVGGASDYEFITDDTQERLRLQELSERVGEGYSNRETLLAFAREYDADYIVVAKNPEMPLLENPLVFENQFYSVYQADDSNAGA